MRATGQEVVAMTAPLDIGITATLLSAPIIGFAFGWFLERGGLGNARKLSGMFYLADFTVLKVLFSALVTAMLGAFWLDRLGVLQLELVYLPETFVLPQAVGGALFGVGFLIGGLCPGTSCVAAASGRYDGLGVIAGMLFGIILFNAGFGFIETFYASTPLGAVTLTDLLRWPHGVSVAAITGGALLAFVIAERVERG
jgi:hypothetical protein